MKIFRWILCLPIGLASMLIAQYIIQIGIGGYFGAEAGSILDSFYTILAVGTGSALGVYSAAYIAPTYKQWVSLIMAALIVGSHIYFIPASIDAKDWLFIISGLFGDAVAIYIVYLVFRGTFGFNREDLSGW